MQSGDRVRLVTDPGRVGMFTGGERSVGATPYVQVSFHERTEWVPADQVEPLAEGAESPVSLLARGRLAGPGDLYRTLTHIRLSGRLANFIYSLETTDTDFYAYQFKPVVKLLQSVSTGILVADEVGLGKTIEAGLIWTELRSRFDLQRLLVVCPAMLREKWARELRTRFGVNPDILGAEELVGRLREVVAGTGHEFAIVASLQGLRPPSDWEEAQESGNPRAELARLLNDRRQEEPLVDLLVIDEAHYLRNPETRTAELGALLRSVSQYVVLLSATPVHLRSADLFHLLRLIDEDTFDRPDVFESIRQANERLVTARDAVLGKTVDADELASVIRRALAHPLLKGNRQLSSLLDDLAGGLDLGSVPTRVEVASRLEAANLLGFFVTRTRRREVKEWRAVREPLTLKVRMNDLERRFYEMVTGTVRDYCAQRGQIEGFLLVMPQRQVASSMAAALWYWSQGDPDVLEELYEDLGIDLPDAEPSSLGPLITELRSRTAQLGNLLELTAADTKYGALRDHLKAFIQENPREKVVVFSSFRHTLRYLAERLRKDGLTCALLLGGADDSQQVLDSFENPNGPSVLLSSEVGSEGIDLQFAWVLVNYDLPWNPMRVEQRIGRLDRLGQQSGKVAIWNLVHENTIDDRIYDRLFVRLGIFERTLGALEAVLGPPIRELTRDLFSRHLSPDEERARIDQTHVALENVRRTEAALEDQASSLVAYGDYIVRQVQAARDLARRISEADIQRYVLDYLGQHYPGCDLFQDGDDPAVVSIGLTPAAKNDLTAFLRTRRGPVGTALSRNAPESVRCRFENRLRVPARRDEETISQLHPLVRFVAHAAEQTGAIIYPAVAVGVHRNQATSEVAPGDYLVAVMRWSVDALRSSEQLWYGAIPIDRSLQALGDDEGERLVTLAASEGAPWPSASVEHDCSALARLAEDELLKRGGEAFGIHVRRLKAQNDDLADAQLRSLEAHLAHQRSKYEQLRARFLDRGNLGLAQVQLGNIDRLTARVERERLRISQRRQMRASFDDVSVGIVRVE
jgi:superfamily II DNA or RNA helicase